MGTQVCYWLLGASVLCVLFSCRAYLAPARHWRSKSCHQLSLLLICRDQEEHIEGVVRHVMGLVGVMTDQRLQLDLVIVDDRSTDSSPLIIERLLRCYRQLRAARLDATVRSTESAVEIGLALCQYPFTIVCDMRGEADVPRMLADVSSLLGPARFSLQSDS